MIILQRQTMQNVMEIFSAISDFFFTDNFSETIFLNKVTLVYTEADVN